MTPFTRAVERWFADAGRDLPWRDAATSPWQILISEVMLQQTPVTRVLPRYLEWVAQWPTPHDLAAAPVSDAISAWAGLGYPRRARRLWEAAGQICQEFGGHVPDDEQSLLTLPGVGPYTAAAVAAFAFGRRTAVVDVNVARVITRAVDGLAFPPAAPSAADRARALTLLPRAPQTAVRRSAAVMELGALVCRIEPDCPQCPLRRQCAFLEAGRPAGNKPKRQPAFAGSDRQARGQLLRALGTTPRSDAELARIWPEDAQRTRALTGLIADRLVEQEHSGFILARSH